MHTYGYLKDGRRIELNGNRFWLVNIAVISPSCYKLVDNCATHSVRANIGYT